MNYIPYARQNISKEDIEAVVKTLRSANLTQGPAIEEFEKKTASYVGAKYAVAVNSATAALHIASLAAGLSEGGLLWTSPNTFVASANCALYCGAKVDFVDIDPITYNMSVKELSGKLGKTSSKHGNPKPDIVIPVHFSGQPCDMAQIHKLSKEYGFTVIEDASHAVGASYKGTQVGCCAYSDMTVLSFHPVKIITTGEGGMVLTNREDLYEKLLLLRSHGITRNKGKMSAEDDGAWYYEQIELGFNYRLTDIQAALGTSQLERIDIFVKQRRRLAARYDEAFQDAPLVTPRQHSDAYSSYHLYVIKLNPEKIKITRKEAFENLRRLNIGVNVHYIPVHTQPYYQQLGFKWGDFPQAEKYYEQAISLPMYYDLTDEEQGYVISKVKEVLA